VSTGALAWYRYRRRQSARRQPGLDALSVRATPQPKGTLDQQLDHLERSVLVAGIGAALQLRHITPLDQQLNQPVRPGRRGASTLRLVSEWRAID
jgi:hypothetical protein